MMAHHNTPRSLFIRSSVLGHSTILLLALALSACETAPHKGSQALDQIKEEMSVAAKTPAGDIPPSAIADALLPPLRMEFPKGTEKRLEPRFDLLVNNAPANQVFLGMVSGTRYSMLLHTEVAGSLSLNLKDVTVPEAMDAIRNLYGYDYKIDGARIYVYPTGLQTRVFEINYLTSQRKGQSDIRVTSGSVTDSGSSGTSSSMTATQTSTSSQGQQVRSLVTSSISTSSTNEFWKGLDASVKAIVGDKEGRSVVVNADAGLLVVRAMPDELRNLETFLKRTQLAVERQVILEAKIIEVTLKDSNQTGINWAALHQNKQLGLGVGVDARSYLYPSGTPVAGSTVGGVLGAGIAGATGTNNGLFGIAIQAGSNFAAVMNFLETQGDVHVLSSPRVATLNNQQAVLKVGTDEFFVTNVSSSTTSTVSGTTSLPNVTLQPFFSGIVLDVTPQIDVDNNIILHVHPSVSEVTGSQKEVDLGTAGNLKLPLAKSKVSETDSIVRAQDGQIVAIGGLMKQSTNNARNGVPGVGDVPVLGHLFRNTSRAEEKSELVILLKPTVVKGAGAWNQDILRSEQRIRAMATPAPGQPPAAPQE